VNSSKEVSATDRKEEEEGPPIEGSWFSWLGVMIVLKPPFGRGLHLLFLVVIKTNKPRGSN